MASIGELRREVESNPDDYPARWRLAKMLYAESDYREALAHLRILKGEWERRLNVLRYLAAAYYRLGRYDEAIGELIDCIDTWPNEISLHEQLAKVYSAAGRTTEAAETWENLLELDPSNRMARKALQRRGNASSSSMNTPYPVSAPHESDDGVDLRPVKVCPQCGAQNSAEFERCWQCGASLTGSDTPVAMLVEGDAPRAPSMLAARVGMALFIGVLAAALYMTVRHVPTALGDVSASGPPATVAEVFLRELTPARLTLWVALLISGALVMAIAIRLLKLKDAGLSVTLGLPAAFATAIYLASWMPPPLLYAGVAGVLVLTVPVTTWMARAAIWRGAIAGLLLCAVLAAVTGGIGMAFVGAGIIEEGESISAFAMRHDAQDAPGMHEPVTIGARSDFFIEWSSTGSGWLDNQANKVAIEISFEPVDERVQLEIYRGETMVDSLPLERAVSQLHTRVETGVSYRGFLRGPEGLVAEMRIEGILTPTVTLTEPVPEPAEVPVEGPTGEPTGA